MDSAQYMHEMMSFMRNQKKHSADFKILVLRLMSLYNNNVKLVSAITHVPETIILEWESDQKNDVAGYQSTWSNAVYGEDAK